MVTATSSTVPQELNQNPTNPRPSNHRRSSSPQFPNSKSKMDRHPSLQHSHQSLSKLQPFPLRPSPLHSNARSPHQTQRPHFPLNHQIRHHFFPFSGQIDPRTCCQDWRFERPFCADIVRWLLRRAWGTGSCT